MNAGNECRSKSREIAGRGEREERAGITGVTGSVIVASPVCGLRWAVPGVHRNTA